MWKSFGASLAPGFAQRVAKSRGEAFAIIGIEEAADENAVVAAFDTHGRDANIWLSGNIESCPEGVKQVGGQFTGCFIFADGQCRTRNRYLLAGICRTIVPAKSQIDRQHIKAKKADDRPCSD